MASPIPTATLVDPETVRAWREAGEAAIYDVREEPEWARAHIPGATLLPLSRFDPRAVAPPPGKRLVLHCQSGVRCGKATEILRAAGYAGEIHRLAGGIKAWAEAGGELEGGG